MRSLLVILLAAVIVVILGFVYNVWPATYETGQMKYVEYYDHTCSYLKQDNWNQLPIMCADTQWMRQTFGYFPEMR
jgi:hypothetical protein